MGVSKYSAEFKDEAIKQVTERGYPASEVAERLGITRESLYQWMRTAGVSAGARAGSKVVEKKDQEIATLKAQVKRLEEERDILKKAAAYFAKESR
jgi:transposase